MEICQPAHSYSPIAAFPWDAYVSPLKIPYPHCLGELQIEILRSHFACLIKCALHQERQV
jgi:hypothetical protein